MLLPIGLPSANQITYFCFLFFKTSNLSVILIIYGEFGLLTLLSPSWVLYFWWWALGECRLCYKFKLSCASLSSKRNVQIFHNLSSLILKPAHRHRSHLLWIFRYRLVSVEYSSILVNRRLDEEMQWENRWKIIIHKSIHTFSGNNGNFLRTNCFVIWEQ